MLKSKFVQKCGKLQKSILVKKVGEITKIKNCHKSAGNYNYKNYKKCGKLLKSKIFKKVREITKNAGNYENPNYKKVRDISN